MPFSSQIRLAFTALCLGGCGGLPSRAQLHVSADAHRIDADIYVGPSACTVVGSREPAPNPAITTPIDSEARFSEAFACSTETGPGKVASGIDFNQHLLAVFIGTGAGSSVQFEALLDDGDKLVAVFRSVSYCSGMPPRDALAAATLLVPRSMAGRKLESRVFADESGPSCPSYLP